MPNTAPFPPYKWMSLSHSVTESLELLEFFESRPGERLYGEVNTSLREVVHLGDMHGQESVYMGSWK